MVEIPVSPDAEARLQQIAESLQKPVPETLEFLIDAYPLASDPAVINAFGVLEAWIWQLWKQAENAELTGASVEVILTPLREACQSIKDAMASQPPQLSSQPLRELYMAAADRLREQERVLDLKMHFFDPPYWRDAQAFLAGERDNMIAAYHANGEFERYYPCPELTGQIEALADKMLASAMQDAEAQLNNGHPHDAIVTLLAARPARSWVYNPRYENLLKDAQRLLELSQKTEQSVHLTLKSIDLGDMGAAWEHYGSIDSHLIDPGVFKPLGATLIDFTSLHFDLLLDSAADALKRNFPEVATAILDDLQIRLPEGVLGRREFAEIRAKINRLRQQIEGGLAGQGGGTVQVTAGRPNLEDLTIFISYSSKDRPNVEVLANDLKLLGCRVWYDNELRARGGNKWWSVILENIRQCDLFIFSLTAPALRSKPCSLEYEYAAALNKTILPILLDDVDLRRLPLELQAMQVVEYRQQSKIEFVHLLATLHHLPPVNPLPASMPDEPDTPFDPFTLIINQINQSHLNPDDQRTVIAKIEDLLADADYAHQVPTLLEMLVNTDYLTVPMLRKIEKIQAAL